jgi:hypothetical protein
MLEVLKPVRGDAEVATSLAKPGVDSRHYGTA